MSQAGALVTVLNIREFIAQIRISRNLVRVKGKACTRAIKKKYRRFLQRFLYKNIEKGCHMGLSFYFNF
jgi:hypothetical protein